MGRSDHFTWLDNWISLHHSFISFIWAELNYIISFSNFIIVFWIWNHHNAAKYNLGWMETISSPLKSWVISFICHVTESKMKKSFMNDSFVFYTFRQTIFYLFIYYFFLFIYAFGCSLSYVVKSEKKRKKINVILLSLPLESSVMAEKK